MNIFGIRSRNLLCFEYLRIFVRTRFKYSLIPVSYSPWSGRPPSSVTPEPPGHMAPPTALLSDHFPAQPSLLPGQQHISGSYHLPHLHLSPAYRVSELPSFLSFLFNLPKSHKPLVDHLCTCYLSLTTSLQASESLVVNPND